MKKEQLVKDIMEEPKVLVCAPTDSLESIVEKLVAMENNGTDADIIVVKELNKSVGIMTPIDIFNALQPSYLKVDTGFGNYEVFWKGLFTQRCKRLATKKVHEVMTPLKGQGLSPEDNLMKAANHLVKHKTQIVPVINNGEIIGLVNGRTLFKLILPATAS